MNMNTVDNSQLYELTISPDYVSEWGLWEACRELLQNAIDARNFNYQIGEGMIIIENDGMSLDVRTLLLGQTSKADDPDTIGQFGEGYKLALLVLVRLGYTLRIQNGHDQWEAFFRWSDKYGCDILCIGVTRNVHTDKKLRYTITGVSPLDIDMLKQKYLPDEPLNSIVSTVGPETGSVYVEGLYVCTLNGLSHSYNFSADRLQLGRDRHLASDFNIQFEASRIHALDGDADEVLGLMENDAPDTKYFDSFLFAKKRDALLDAYTAKHGDRIPVASQREIEALPKGVSYRLVPKILRDILWKIKQWVIPAKTPKDRLLEWWDEVRFDLRKQGIATDTLDESFSKIYSELL